MFKPEKEPWAIVGITEPSPLTRKKIIGRLRARLRTGPTRCETASAGTFYISQLRHEIGENYWHMSRTRPVFSEFGATVICSFIAVKNADYIERLIYLYLNYCRVHRRKKILGSASDNMLFLSSWVATGDQIMDEQRFHVATQGCVVSKKKQGDFFHCELIELLTVIKMLVFKFGGDDEKK